jgi:hypothetical protein
VSSTSIPRHADSHSRLSASNRWSASNAAGAASSRLQDDRGDRRIAGAGVGSEEFADRRRALGHPRPVVEQARDGEKRREVDVDRFAAETREPLNGASEQRLDFGVAEERQIGSARQAEAEALRRLRQWAVEGRERRAAVWVGGVEACRRRHRGSGVVGVGGEDRDTIERLASRNNSGGADQAAARFEADQIAEGGRNAA